jgi:OOP family OmpA-OmpF porin
MKPGFACLVCALVVFATSAFAQGGVKGQWELAPYLGAGLPDDYAPVNLEAAAPLVGGRLGYWLSDLWTAELSYHRQFSRKDAGGDVNMDAIRVNFLWNFGPGWPFRPFATLGGGMERVGGGIDQWDPAVNAGLGVKWIVTDFGGFRFDGRYVPVPVGGSVVGSWQHNFEATFSWFMLLGKHSAPETPVAAPAPPAGGADKDADGVADGADRCADTPAGAKVDTTGCPVDSDGDGSFDGLDRCPGTPAGTKVDPMGCPQVSKARGVLKGVTFETASATLTAPSKAVLDEAAAALNEFPEVKVEVQGHTDNTGNADRNLELSAKRAEEVLAYLVGRGVAKERLAAKGYGDTQPVADNSTKAGRRENRRVELKWLDH